MGGLFDNERHRRSEELAFEAERAERSEDFQRAKKLYAEAAKLEEENALTAPVDAPRVRGVLAVSAVALWMRAENWYEAARAGCVFLAAPNLITDGGRVELQSLIERAWRSNEVECIGGDDSTALLEAKLDGGSVRRGLAPTKSLHDRRGILTQNLIRTAEWKSNRAYRKSGQSSLAAQYEILEAPAIAASYSLRLFLTTGVQTNFEGMCPSPKQVVSEFLRLVALATDDPESLWNEMQDEQYAHSLLRAVRDLAPDGNIVGRVDLGSAYRGRLTTTAALVPKTRTRIVDVLKTPREDRPIECVGILRAVNLLARTPYIGIETDQGSRNFYIRGVNENIIGSQLNHQVRVKGVRQVSDDNVQDWALDVELLNNDDDIPF